MVVPSDAEFRLPASGTREGGSRDEGSGIHAHRHLRQRGHDQYGSRRSAPGNRGFLRGGGLWMHVDGAYGGFAVLCESGKALLAGIERADSISLDAHKWLYQPFEAGCVMVKDVAHLVRAFSVNPDYLQDTKLGLEHVNFADRGYQLTRSLPRAEGLDVDPDFRPRALSRGDRAHHPVCDRCRRARRGDRRPRAARPAFPRRAVLPLPAAGRGLDAGADRLAERSHPGARDPVRHGDDFLDAAARHLLAAPVHHVAPDDLGRREARRSGGSRNSGAPSRPLERV